MQINVDFSGQRAKVEEVDEEKKTVALGPPFVHESSGTKYIPLARMEVHTCGMRIGIFELQIHIEEGRLRTVPLETSMQLPVDEDTMEQRVESVDKLLDGEEEEE